MEFLPQYEGITIDFDCQFKVYLKDSQIPTILEAVAMLLPQLFTDFFQKVLVGFGEYSMALNYVEINITGIMLSLYLCAEVCHSGRPLFYFYRKSSAFPLVFVFSGQLLLS